MNSKLNMGLVSICLLVFACGDVWGQNQKVSYCDSLTAPLEIPNDDVVGLSNSIEMGDEGTFSKISSPPNLSLNKENLYLIAVDLDPYTAGIQSELYDPAPLVGSPINVDIVIYVDDPDFSDWNAADINILIEGAESPVTSGVLGVFNEENEPGLIVVKEIISQTGAELIFVYSHGLGNWGVAVYSLTLTVGTQTDTTISFIPQYGSEISNGISTKPLECQNSYIYLGNGSSPTPTNTPMATSTFTYTPTFTPTPTIGIPAPATPSNPHPEDGANKCFCHNQPRLG